MSAVKVWLARERQKKMIAGSHLNKLGHENLDDVARE